MQIRHFMFWTRKSGYVTKYFCNVTTYAPLILEQKFNILGYQISLPKLR